MIHLFIRDDSGLSHLDRALWPSIDRSKLVWVDVVEPSPEDLQFLKDHLGFSETIPEDDIDIDIETSARISDSEDGSIKLRTDFLIGQKQEYDTHPVRLVLQDGILFTLHEAEVGTVRLMRMRCTKRGSWHIDPLDLLIDLLGLDVEHSADALESIYLELRTVSDAVLNERKGTGQDAAQDIALIARQEDLNGTVRRNLMDTRRALSAIARMPRLNKTQAKRAQQILSDIESLDGHTTFIFDKLNFLMDATIGFININQSNVVKIFSVAAVALLPPTLIASIYGMNFENMPELKWDYGYPFSLILMIISVAFPFWYFQRKGWLK
jgi:magnesium transporter